jgi:alpha-galactosidase
MAKVTILGAGSAVFARKLVTDILHIDSLDDGEFALVDIDVRDGNMLRRVLRYAYESA